MLFSEIYSAYYNTVASIIACAQKGKLDSDSLYKLVQESAFPESYLSIGSSLENGKWTLIKKDYSTNIRNTPTMPLSILQKRWLKAIMNDKRFGLFVEPEVLARLENDLQNVDSLFTEKDFYLYDQYSDGDPYDDEQYRKNFREVLKAVHEGKTLHVEYAARLGKGKRFVFLPCKIEYSQKDDKFRCYGKNKNHQTVINIGRIKKCQVPDNQQPSEDLETDLPDNTRTSVTLEIYDDRKALERVMLAFAHFEKSAVQLDENTYRLTLNYDSFDETELVIRVLSFGPMVKVLEPASFVNLVRERIDRQMELGK